MSRIYEENEFLLKTIDNQKNSIIQLINNLEKYFSKQELYQIHIDIMNFIQKEIVSKKNKSLDKEQV